MLSLQTILPNTLELLRKIAALPSVKDMRLVGGTALALQLGHRSSIDLDFFSHEPIDQDTLLEELSGIGKTTIRTRQKTILQLWIDDVKVDFVQYTYYDWIDQPIIDSGIVMASPNDIAAMKINAIMGRGSKKDFVDMFVLLKRYKLSEILDFYKQKYPEYSEYRALLSLTYFEDAEKQEMPPLFIDDTWDVMKHSILKSVKKYQDSL